MCACMRVYMRACMYVCVCMYLCMYVAICVWICMCVQMFVYLHIDIYAVHILCICEEKISMHVCIYE